MTHKWVATISVLNPVVFPNQPGIVGGDARDVDPVIVDGSGRCGL